jgi:hypothetical protein
MREVCGNKLCLHQMDSRFRQFKLKRALDKIPMRDYVRRALYSGNALRFLGKEIL